MTWTRPWRAQAGERVLGERVLNLASANLLSGRSLRDGSFPPLGPAIAGLSADVVAVQEIDRHQPRSGSVDQPAVLASALGGADLRFAENIRGVFGSPSSSTGRGLLQDDDAEPGYGIALLSRKRVREWHFLRMEPGRGRLPMPIPGGPGERPHLIWLRDEPRAAIAAVLEEPRVTVACTHLSFLPATSRQHLAQVREWLEQLPGPRILLGDLNLGPRPVRTRMPGWFPLVRGPSFPSPAPRMQLDHALCDDPTLAVAQARIVELPISDHRALKVSVRL